MKSRKTSSIVPNACSLWVIIGTEKLEMNYARISALEISSCGLVVGFKDVVDCSFNVRLEAHRIM